MSKKKIIAIVASGVVLAAMALGIVSFNTAFLH